MSAEFDIIPCSLAPKGDNMEQGKSKYEIAKQILDNFKIGTISIRQFQNENLSETEKVEKALEWYLKQYKKVLKTFNDS